MFLDMTIHDFDLARFVTGSDIVEVNAAVGAVLVDPAVGEVGDIDTSVVVLTHRSGCITIIDNSRQAVYGYDQRLEVFGSAGMATSENPPTHTAVVGGADGFHAVPLYRSFIDRYELSFIRQWESFVDSVRSGVLPGGQRPRRVCAARRRPGGDRIAGDQSPRPALTTPTRVLRRAARRSVHLHPEREAGYP